MRLVLLLYQRHACRMQATLNVTEEQKQRLLDARRALIKRVEGIVSERRSAQPVI